LKKRTHGGGVSLGGNSEKLVRIRESETTNDAVPERKGNETFYVT